MSHNTGTIVVLILLNLGHLGILIRLRWIDKAIEQLPYIIRIQAEGRERYVELLERKVIEQ